MTGAALVTTNKDMPITQSLTNAERLEVLHLEDRLLSESDVRKVVKLRKVGERFQYLIETPFETFPRYVVGTTDCAFDDVRIQMRCSALWSAEDWWEKSARIMLCSRCAWLGAATKLAYAPEDAEETNGHCPQCGGEVKQLAERMSHQGEDLRMVSGSAFQRAGIA